MMLTGGTVPFGNYHNLIKSSVISTDKAVLTRRRRACRLPYERNIRSFPAVCPEHPCFVNRPVHVRTCRTQIITQMEHLSSAVILKSEYNVKSALLKRGVLFCLD